MSTDNPAQIIIHLARAYWASRCLHVVAEVGVADALDESPRAAAELAAATGTHPGALHRVLRVLSSCGIFTLKDGRFSHNDASRLLRTDAPGSMRSLARTFGLEIWWRCYGALEHSLRTGRPAPESVSGQGLFDYLGEHPHQAGLFAETMLAGSRALIPSIVAACDFRDARVIGDIGGGLGHLLAAVLEANGSAQGILFDRPEVIDPSRATPVPRMTYLGGDFFRDPIPACDIYLLKRVLHDWADPEAAAILANIRAGAAPGARVLLIEGVLDEATPGALAEIDIEMLVMTGGRERTREEWQSLLAAAGMRLDRVVATASPVASVLEAVIT